jgi:hypothetical protein
MWRIWGSHSDGSATSSDRTLCSPLKVGWSAAGTSLLHLQGRAVSQLCLLPVHAGGLLLGPWLWSRHVPPKRRLTLSGLHGVVSQKSCEVFFYNWMPLKMAMQHIGPYKSDELDGICCILFNVKNVWAVVDIYITHFLVCTELIAFWFLAYF